MTGRDLIISCAGLRRVPDWLPWSGEPPKLLEWPGAPTASGHPSWKVSARTLRDADGAILPTLLARYRRFLGFDLGSVGRIAVVGFSAGSNSGVRELLRSPLDRARVSFVAAIDGMHPMWARRRVRRSELEAPAPSDPESMYLDWTAQMQPFAAYALDAAQDQGGAMVATASQVRPSSGASVAPSYVALASLYQWVAQRSDATEPWLPPAFPPRSSSPTLQSGEDYPLPIQVQGARRFVALWYAGQTTRAHELQAWVVVPDVLRSFLVPLWGGADPILVGDAPEPVEPSALEPPASSSPAGLPFWTPAAFGAAAAVASAFV